MGHHVPQVAQRDHVAQPEGVPAVDQQLQHDLQGRPLPLQSAGDRHQRLDQGRAEGVDELEHRPVGFPGQQDLHDLLPHLGGLLERLLQLGPAGIVLGLQDPLLGDHRQVAVLQGDRVEPAFPVLQYVAEVQLSTPVTFSPISSRRSRCRATKLMIGTGRSDLRDSTSLASLCPSSGRSPGRPSGWPARGSARRGTGSGRRSPETLGVVADDAQALVEIDVGFVLTLGDALERGEDVLRPGRRPGGCVPRWRAGPPGRPRTGRRSSRWPACPSPSRPCLLAPVQSSKNFSSPSRWRSWTAFSKISSAR